VAQQDTPRGRGRPPGTEESPESIIRGEAIANGKLYRRLRKLVEEKLDQQSTMMDVDELTKYMEVTRKGVVDLSKLIVAPVKAEAATDKGKEEDDPDAILEGLLKG
jgi:hypothetical protein